MDPAPIGTRVRVRRELIDAGIVGDRSGIVENLWSEDPNYPFAGAYVRCIDGLLVSYAWHELELDPTDEDVVALCLEILQELA